MDTDVIIDERANSLARRALDKDIDETYARWRIAALVPKSGVPGRVASRDARFYGKQAQLDYAEHLREKLLNLIMGQGFNIELIAGGASLSGWMNSICSSAISKMSVRQVVQPYNRRVHRAVETEPIRMVPLTPDVDVESSDEGDEWFSAWEEAFREFSPSARLHNAQIHLRAKMLAGAYHLFAPKRGVYLANRSKLLNALDDPKAASNDTITSLSTGKAQGLAVLWDNQLEAMADVPTMVTHALALAALTPVSPPTVADLKSVRSRIPLPLHQAGRLIRAFANYYAETYNTEHSHKSLEPKTLHEHLVDADEFNDAAISLGDPATVYDNLCEILAEVERSRFKP